MFVSCECLCCCCCQVDASATSRSLVQGSPTECGVSECDCEASKNEAAVELLKKKVQSYQMKQVKRYN
jgi:hypothetical protein